MALSALLIIPVAFFVELAFGQLRVTGFIVNAIASAKDLVSQDIAFLGELTPAIAATFVTALAPRPMTKVQSFSSFIICGFGYLAYLFVSVHLDGSSILVGRSLQDNVEVALEGNFPDSDLDGAMLLVRSTMESLRIFYLVMLAAIVGFSFNSEGRGNG